MISNMYTFARGLHRHIMKGGGMLPSLTEKSFDWDNVEKNKSKLTAMRSKRDSDVNAAAPLDLEAVRARVGADKPRRDGLSQRDRHKSAMNRWFKGDGENSSDEIIAQRLLPAPASRLPAIEPLPSSEDSFLAFTCDDEIFFDAPVLERWKQFVDEKTAVVRVRRAEETDYSFAGEVLFENNYAASVAL